MENDELPLLTLAIFEANHYNNWEPALTYSLPAEPSIDLIDAAIDEVLKLWCKLALVMRWVGLCRIEGPQRESSGKRRVP
jgi:hypothetical protein